jgi:hypothetical protein
MMRGRSLDGRSGATFPVHSKEVLYPDQLTELLAYETKNEGKQKLLHIFSSCIYVME